jgi:uncharacterized delta-60 repeat protein
MRRMVAAACVVLLGACGSSSGKTATPTSTARPTALALDPAFGDGGVVTVDDGAGYAEARAVAVDDRGRPVVAARVPGGKGAVVRFRADGRVDPGFGDGGRAPSPFAEPPRAVAIQDDGRIVVAGTDGTGFAVARLEADGSLDRTFGTDGVTVVGFDGVTATANAVAVTRNGAIALGGVLSHPTDGTFRALGLARVDEQGRLDRTFGDGGSVRVADHAGVATPGAMAVDDRGRIVVVAAVERAAPGEPANTDGSISRFTADGRPDAPFGDSGSVIVDLGSPFDTLTGVVVERGGAVLAVGSTNPEGRAVKVAAVRRSANGAPDRSFGTRGLAVASPATLSEGSAVVGRDGGAVVVGRVADDAIRSDTAWEWALIPMGDDGTAGPTVVRADIGHRVLAAVADRDGRIVAVGCTCPSDPNGRGGFETDSSMVIARYGPAGD